MVASAGLSTGIHAIGAEEYHADPCPVSLSASGAATMLRRSPLHAWHEHPRLGGAPREASGEMDVGTVLHSLLLGVGRDMVVVRIGEGTKAEKAKLAKSGITPAQIDAPNYLTDEAKEKRDAIRAEGKLPVLAREELGYRTAAEVISKQLATRGVALSGVSEACAVWRKRPSHHPGMGSEIQGEDLFCRSMIDHLIIRDDSATIYDLKTMAESAHPKAATARVMKYGEDIQVAAYIDAVETIYPHLRGRVEFFWIFAEQNPPYAVTLAQPDGMMLDYGARRWHRACELWSRCLAADRWPGYSEEVVKLSPPNSAMAEEIGEMP